MNTAKISMLLAACLSQAALAAPAEIETYCAVGNSDGYRNIRTEKIHYGIDGNPETHISIWNLHIPHQMTYVKSVRLHQTGSDTTEQYMTETAEWPNGIFCKKENANPVLCQQKTPDPKHSLFHDFASLPAFILPQPDGNMPFKPPGMPDSVSFSGNNMAPMAQMLSAMATFMNMPVKEFMAMMLNMMQNMPVPAASVSTH